MNGHTTNEKMAKPCLCRAVLQPWYHFHTPFHSCWEPASGDTKWTTCLVLALFPGLPTVQFLIDGSVHNWRWNVWVHFNDFNVYQCTQWGEGVLTEQMSLRLTCSLPLSARVLIQNIREAENFLHIVKGEDVCAKQALSLGNPFSHST